MEEKRKEKEKAMCSHWTRGISRRSAESQTRSDFTKVTLKMLITEENARMLISFAASAYERQKFQSSLATFFSPRYSRQTAGRPILFVFNYAGIHSRRKNHEHPAHEIIRFNLKCFSYSCGRHVLFVGKGKRTARSAWKIIIPNKKLGK